MEKWKTCLLFFILVVFVNFILTLIYVLSKEPNAVKSPSVLENLRSKEVLAMYNLTEFIAVVYILILYFIGDVQGYYLWLYLCAICCGFFVELLYRMTILGSKSLKESNQSGFLGSAAITSMMLAFLFKNSSRSPEECSNNDQEKGEGEKTNILKTIFLQLINVFFLLYPIIVAVVGLSLGILNIHHLIEFAYSIAIGLFFRWFDRLNFDPRGIFIDRMYD